MPLLLPVAGALSTAAAQAIATLALPRLEKLLALLTPGPRDVGDEASLSPPHERALAAALGWPVVDGLLPLAARAAAADGLQPRCGNAAPGWGLLSPTHWLLGTEQITLVDPAALALDDADARTLFDALRPLFDEVGGSGDGWSLHWGAANRWYACHPSLTTLPTASLDRAVGQPLDRWLNRHPDAQRMRRLQAEAQMLLHRHPLNEAREERGDLAVNSFWLSGTGPTQPASGEPADLTVDDRLRTPALAGDWTAWAEAWAALDAGPLREALGRAGDGQPVTLTLCGERAAQRFDLQPRTALKRWFGARSVAAAPLLESL